MENILFYEPKYDAKVPNIWRIRGGNKYPSILGDLGARANVSILMSALPPGDDAYRLRLEREFGVRFVSLASADVATPDLADELAADLEGTFRTLKPTVISNLNGRSVGYHYAAAIAAWRCDMRFVQRIAGNDIEARANVMEARRRPFWGTGGHVGAVTQERVASHLADSIIVMSNRERARVETFVEEARKIQVCFRGVDQTRFAPAVTGSPRCRRFLFVGRQSYEKGYDIVEKAAHIVEDMKLDVSITFAGTFEPMKQGIRDYVGFVDYKDLPALYRDHDALILCSRSEGFPQVIMEAMSSGLPCIITRHLFEKEFRDETDCLLVDAEAESVAKAIVRLHRDENFFRRLRSDSIDFALKHFSEDQNRSKYQSVLIETRAQG